MKLDVSYTLPQIRIFFQTSSKFLVVTKGRRFGATHGAAHAFIEFCLEGKKLLWGDTINSNIDRYVQRYFEPVLKSSSIPYNWSSQKKELRILNGHIDFRSADRPENWEGFGYDLIFLNEAGIILRDPYLYTNAVLPMLMDYPDSRLIAAGVPKGKTGKNGKQHVFYKMKLSADMGVEGYEHLAFSSYDNPKLNSNDVKILEDEIKRMNPKMVDQEIYGLFVDGAGGLLWDDKIIEKQRINVAPKLTRVVVSIDPATTTNLKSDETGIVVCGYAGGNKYLLEDASGKYSPNEWATVAFMLQQKWRASCYVAEKNQGGDMVEAVLRTVDKRTRIKLNHASKGKFTRAEPIFSEYELGKIFHVGYFPYLESEMTTFNPSDPSIASPNRMDALVWGMSELTNVPSSSKILL